MGLRERDSTIEEPMEGIERTLWVAHSDRELHSRAGAAFSLMDQPFWPREVEKFDIIPWYCGCMVVVHEVRHDRVELVVFEKKCADDAHEQDELHVYKPSIRFDTRELPITESALKRNKEQKYPFGIGDGITGSTGLRGATGATGASGYFAGLSGASGVAGPTMQAGQTLSLPYIPLTRKKKTGLSGARGRRGFP